MKGFEIHHQHIRHTFVHTLQELWTYECTTTPHWWRPWKQQIFSKKPKHNYQWLMSMDCQYLIMFYNMISECLLLHSADETSVHLHCIKMSSPQNTRVIQ